MLAIVKLAAGTNGMWKENGYETTTCTRLPGALHGPVLGQREGATVPGQVVVVVINDESIPG